MTVPGSSQGTGDTPAASTLFTAAYFAAGPPVLDLSKWVPNHILFIQIVNSESHQWLGVYWLPSDLSALNDSLLTYEVWQNDSYSFLPVRKP